MELIIVYITHPDMKTAKRIVTQLLERRLVACANFFPIDSMNWWQGKIETSKEIVSIVKTKKSNWQKVKAEVLKLHPYEVPCVMKIEAEASADYVKWINKEVE